MIQTWERQRDDDGDLEPMLWFARFTLYRQMGSDRSLLGTVNEHRNKKSQKKSNYTPGAWRDAYKQWNWKERAEAWDAYELNHQAELFQERADAWRAGRFDDAEELRDKARQLLKLPVIRRTGKDGDGTPYTVEAVLPTTLKAAAQILKTADELARITTRETLPKIETDVTSDGDKIEIVFVNDWRDNAPD